MATRQDFQVLAEKFRMFRPEEPNHDPLEFAVGGIYEGMTEQELRQEYERQHEVWKCWRARIMDACQELNPRFKRDWFIGETER